MTEFDLIEKTHPIARHDSAEQTSRPFNRREREPRVLFLLKPGSSAGGYQFSSKTAQLVGCAGASGTSGRS